MNISRVCFFFLVYSLFLLTVARVQFNDFNKILQSIMLIVMKKRYARSGLKTAGRS